MTDRELFIAALERDDPAARRAYLRDACGADSATRQRVEALFQVYEDAGSFLESPPAAATITMPPASSAEACGTVIGPYKLLEVIGEGGMGTVFMAEQTQPVRRKVALKLIKPGLDTRQVLARFEAERQALALMDHPNIARVLDAGTTDSGRPYFVMELVKGVPITQFCDERRLTPRERLELFLPVCQAVQHAHQKGVIHRDLKPSNVLVALYDGRPVPKVIDFGVAKATGPRLTERTLFTEFGAIVGTPEYMSPEQAELNQHDVDTRSDIYSLGVLLYELLTGTTPLQRKRLKEAALLEVLRLVREEDPPRPSTRLSTTEGLPSIAANRNVEPRKLTALVRGELDWIVMKCLDRDRARRYETATGLAADLRRYLDDRPIEARRPTLAGRLRRFVRRNKVPAALGGLGLAAVAVAASFAVFAQAKRLRELELTLSVNEARERERSQTWAREIAVPRIAKQLEDDRVLGAFRLAHEAEQALPNDPALKDLWDQLAAPASIDSVPSGARVAIRDWRDVNGEWLELGQAPLKDRRLPRRPLRWRFAKPGYIDRELVAELRELSQGPVRLSKASEAPEGMVFIPPGPAEWGRMKTVEVGAFWIDRFEVTNRQFQAFLNAGGYEDRRYWKEEFIKDGVVLSREAAMPAFRDRTGRPGPATWEEGRYPPGEEDYPVRGVSWYEAAAFATYSNKDLPTLAHWRRAACLDQDGYIVTLSNISASSSGPAPVGGFRGIGRFDVYDMAGNVKEWCRSARGTNDRMIAGGAWGEPTWMFQFPQWSSPFARQPTCGFRCVKYLEGPSPEPPWNRLINPRRYEAETPASPQLIEAYKRHYLYDRDAPLYAQLVSRDGTNKAFRHEVMRIDAAYGGERFDVHLFLPHGERPRYKTIVWFPGAGSADIYGRFSVRQVEDEGLVPGLVARGWAVCWPIYKGTHERGGGLWPSGHQESIRGRDWLIMIAKDLSRSVDYLQTRGDLASEKLAYCGFSWGAQKGPVMIVVEPRFKAAVLIFGGHRRNGPLMPEVEPFQFAPHVRIPVLMINGRRDQVFLPEWHQEPFYEHLGTKDKRRILLDAAHAPPVEETLDLAHAWLLEKLTVPD